MLGVAASNRNELREPDVYSSHAAIPIRINPLRNAEPTNRCGVVLWSALTSESAGFARTGQCLSALCLGDALSCVSPSSSMSGNFVFPVWLLMGCTAEQICVTALLFMTAGRRQSAFIDFVIRSAPRMAGLTARNWASALHQRCLALSSCKLALRSSYRYCARVRFCANPFEVICGSLIWEIYSKSKRKMRLLKPAIRIPTAKTHDNVPSGSHPQRGE